MNLKTGAVIHLRNRIWRVDRVEEKEFAATPLDGRDARRWRFLRDFEEQNASPGELPPPDPEKVSDPATQDLLLRAYRLSLIHGSAPFMGLQRSRAIPEPYQLVPLLMALNMSPVRLLIGDDVGVGKTIEAGLIVSELFSRGWAERMLVVVPAPLREQWQETLSRFFHLDSVILAGHTLPALERQLLPHQSPWEAFPIVVASIDFLKRRINTVTSYPWDIVIVDEAHIAAKPHEREGMATAEKERWELLSALSVCEKINHLLLLSATPHPGYTDCFASLLQCLNPETVNHQGRINRQVATKHTVQRRRKDIKEWYGDRKPFPDRDPKDHIIAMSAKEDDLLKDLRSYGSFLERQERHSIGQWVSLHLQRRALSSPEAIRKSLNTRLKAALKRISGSEADKDKAKIAEAEATILDQDSTSDLEDEERWTRLDTAGLTATDLEVKRIKELQEAAKKVNPNQDKKLKKLVEVIPEILKKHPKNPRLIVFTRYKDTLSYLENQLEKTARKRNSPLNGFNVFTIHGGLAQSKRREVFRAFERTEKSICIATDCISEGIDLQRACAAMVHYELPWNPNRLEQRNGRIDRYGQPEKVVTIRTLVREDPLDVTILETLIRKAGKIREDYGFCPVFLSSGRELKALIKRHTPVEQQLLFQMDDESSIPGVAPDLFDEDRIKTIEEESFYGQEDVRLPKVEAALNQTYYTVGSPEEIKGFVESALNRFGARTQAGPDGTFEIRFPNGELRDFGEKMIATFDPAVAMDDPEVEHLEIAHPLVRRMIELIRREAMGEEEGRVAVKGSTGVTEVTAILHVLARYVSASEPPVLMEELIPIAFHPYSDPPVEDDPVEILRKPPATLRHGPDELKELAKDSLSSENLGSLIEEAVEKRRQLLTEYQKEIAELSGNWAEGMAEVKTASIDQLTLTILVPGHA